MTRDVRLESGYILEMPRYVGICLSLLSAAFIQFAFGQEAKPPFIKESQTWQAPEGSVFPGREWEKLKSPELAGFSSARLDAIRAWLKTQNTTGMLVVVGGYVLFEYGDVAQVSKIASVRKSVLGMLVGNYVANGLPCRMASDICR